MGINIKLLTKMSFIGPYSPYYYTSYYGGYPYGGYGYGYPVTYAPISYSYRDPLSWDLDFIRSRYASVYDLYGYHGSRYMSDWRDRYPSYLDYLRDRVRVYDWDRYYGGYGGRGSWYDRGAYYGDSYYGRGWGRPSYYGSGYYGR